MAAENLHHLDRAAQIYPRSGHEAHAARIGGVFLGAGMGKEAALRGPLYPRRRPGGEFAAAGGDPGGSGKGAADAGCGAGIARIDRAAHQVAIGDMRGLMRDDRLQNGRRLHAQDHAGMDEDRIGIDDKGVHPGIVDHQDAHPRGAQPGGLENGGGQFFQGMFDIGVAQQRQCPRRRCRQKAQDQRNGEKTNKLH